MSRWHSYLNSARDLLLAYDGEEPFSSFSKKYFAQYKKFGSTDRKQIIHLCYCYFRLGKAAMELGIEERIMAALFLCSSGAEELLEALKPDWNEKTSLPLNDKLALLNIKDLQGKLFPAKQELSDGISEDEFVVSHLIQPDLFLRLRPGQQDIVKNKLTDGAISFRTLTPDCIALPNSSKIDTIVNLDKEAVVQDYSSQMVGQYIKLALENIPEKQNHTRAVNAWDCCAGSGGKSIITYDADPTIQLTVSDRRESILINLKKRFRAAGIRHFDSYVIDVSNSLPLESQSSKGFDLIIADVPCSGSGTWGRTPEQLVYFLENKIIEYSELQRKIAGNVIQQLKQGGYFLYITCSVYKNENEEIVKYLLKNPAIELVKSEILKGYLLKADTMFAALFHNKETKPSS